MCRTVEEVSRCGESEIGKSVNTRCHIATTAQGRFQVLTKATPRLTIGAEASEDNYRGHFAVEKTRDHCHSFMPIGLLNSLHLCWILLLEAIDAVAPNASMSTTPNGSGPELEKFPDAPPTIEITAPEEVPDAGLRSLDHCEYSRSFLAKRARIRFQLRSLQL
jgi:hypothetical protein